MSERKKPPEAQEEGAPAWMCTYGDMVTLILTFFILLFSFSTIDAKKWEEVVASFTGARMIVIQPLDPGAVEKGFDFPTPRPTPPANEEQKEEFDELYQRIRQHIQDNDLESQLAVDKSDDVILLRVTDSILFDSGKADIKPEAHTLLAKVAQLFDEYETSIAGIRIEGHTDNVPIHTAQFNDNWDLSTARATGVLRFFLTRSVIPPPKYTASGYGEYHPVASNLTDEGKTQNRRVDFVIQGVQNN